MDIQCNDTTVIAVTGGMNTVHDGVSINVVADDVANSAGTACITGAAQNGNVCSVEVGGQLLTGSITGAITGAGDDLECTGLSGDGSAGNN